MVQKVEILEPLEAVLAREEQRPANLTRLGTGLNHDPWAPAGRAVHRGKSLRGAGKPDNDDRHLAQGARQHYALFDGLGSGHSSGQIAAMAAHHLSVLDMVSRDPHLLSAQLEATLTSLSDQIYDWSQATGLATGCTLAGLVRVEGGALLYAAGDTRAYRYRSGLLTQLTVDHRAFDPITGQPGLARALGASPHLGLDIRQIDVRSGDYFLLCTDGVHETLTDAQLSLVFSMGFEVDEQCTLLTQQLLQAQPQDDASFLLIPGAALIQNFRGQHG